MADMSRKAHPCNNCVKSFSSSHQLAQHVRIHSNEKPYKCSVCEKSFKQLSHVQQHTRLHTGERPYKCSELNCGRSFIQLSNLQQHMKTHSSSNGLEKQERSEKRYVNSTQCPVCSKSYVNEGSLRKHIQTTHSDVIIDSSSFNNNTQSNNTTQVNFLLTCTPADLKGQNNTIQYTNNSANNLLLISNNNISNNAIFSLTTKVLNSRSNSKKH